MSAGLTRGGGGFYSVINSKNKIEEKITMYIYIYKTHKHANLRESVCLHWKAVLAWTLDT